LKVLIRASRKLVEAFRLRENRLNIFYLLAFAPLLMVTYYNILNLSPLMFGFLLLFLKSQDLSVFHEASRVQRVVGLAVLLSSFVLCFALLHFFPFIPFYGVAASYSVYISGLFLTFFDLPALREAFTPIFVIVAASSVSFISIWLGLHLSPHIIPRFVSIVGTILNTLGVETIIQYPSIIVLNTVQGTNSFSIIWECIGAYSTLVFSLIMIIVIFEEPDGLRTKILWAVLGIVGVLVLNVLRIVIILMIARYYTFAVAELLFHPFLGYVLFFPWLGLLLYTFPKRHVLLKKIRLIRQKLR